MSDRRERARDMAEEGLDRLIDGDPTGKELIDKARKLDPGAVEELAREVERDNEQAERFRNRPAERAGVPPARR